jgi:hypothetical protein
MLCPECGHEFPPAVKTQKEVKETALVELNLAYNKIRGRKISDLNPQELLIYTNSTGHKAFAKRVARAKGNDFLTDYAKLCGWKYGWWNFITPDSTLNFNDITIK